MPDAVHTLVVTYTGDDIATLEKIAQQATTLARTTLASFDGFLSSRILLSREGHRIAIVTDWASRESLAAAQTAPEVTAVIAEHIEGTQTTEVHVYERYAAVTGVPAE